MNRRSFLIGFGALITGATVLGSDRKWWQVPGDRALQPTLMTAEQHAAAFLYGGAAGGGKTNALRVHAAAVGHEAFGVPAGFVAARERMRGLHAEVRVNGELHAVVPFVHDTYDVIPVRDLRADEAVRWMNEPGISPQERARRKELTFGIRYAPGGMNAERLTRYQPGVSDKQVRDATDTWLSHMAGLAAYLDRAKSLG